MWSSNLSLLQRVETLSESVFRPYPYPSFRFSFYLYTLKTITLKELHCSLLFSILCFVPINSTFSHLLWLKTFFKFAFLVDFMVIAHGIISFASNILLCSKSDFRRVCYRKSTLFDAYMTIYYYFRKLIMKENILKIQMNKYLLSALVDR